MAAAADVLEMLANWDDKTRSNTIYYRQLADLQSSGVIEYGININAVSELRLVFN